ncbi:MAG: acyl-CoA thioesterase II, partial [Pseudomonadota bacterium]
HGRPILNLAASFKCKEDESLAHQIDMPEVPGPDGLTSLGDINHALLDRVPTKMHRWLRHEPPFEFRPVAPPKIIDPSARPPVKHLWMKARSALPDQLELHRSLLAYVSDYELLGTATLPHELNFDSMNVMMASLDHGLWFHQPFRVDDWLLYALDSPSSGDGRGYARGQVFTRDGQLVASTVQEGVIRKWRD